MIAEHPLFASASLSPCQQEALKMLNNLVSGPEKLGILRGYAGTGKTYLTALLVKYLQSESDFRVVVMTPTGRAAKVLETEFDRQGIFISPRTIHSVIYKIDPTDYSAQQPSLFASVGTSDDETPCFYIIDESSMVGAEKRDRKDEGLNFGSGSLLHDVLEFVNLKTHASSRVLFVGDPGQLPPIQGTERTPALLSHDLLSVLTELEMPNEHILEHELNTVLRQEDGSLKHFVTEVRHSIQHFTRLPRNQREQVKPIPPQEVVPTYLARNEGLRLPHKSVILAHKNADVYGYNREVRQQLNIDHCPMWSNEVLLVRRNRKVVDYGELNISRRAEDLTNGTFIQLVDEPAPSYESQVPVQGEVITLNFWKANIRKVGTQHVFSAVILQNMLDPEFWRDYQSNMRKVESAIIIDFQQRMLKDHKLKPPRANDVHYHRYKTMADHDPYLNALRVNYGYAVTVHNAQGGEWDTVIVDPRNPSREYDSVQHRISYARWVYTASTRARKELFFVKP